MAKDPIIVLPKGKEERIETLYQMYLASKLTSEAKIFQQIREQTGNGVSIRTLKTYKAKYDWKRGKMKVLPASKEKKSVKSVEPTVPVVMPPIKHPELLAHKGNFTEDEALQIASAIMEVYVQGVFNIGDCCNTQGVSKMTLWNWCQKYTTVRKMYDRARLLTNMNAVTQIEYLRNNLLQRKLEQDKVEETTVEYRLDNEGKYKEYAKYVRTRELSVQEVVRVNPEAMAGFAELIASSGDQFDAMTDEELMAWVAENQQALDALNEEAKNGTDG